MTLGLFVKSPFRQCPRTRFSVGLAMLDVTALPCSCHTFLLVYIENRATRRHVPLTVTCQPTMAPSSRTMTKPTSDTIVVATVHDCSVSFSVKPKNRLTSQNPLSLT